jgi:hypothetical protein
VRKAISKDGPPITSVVMTSIDGECMAPGGSVEKDTIIIQTELGAK